jgi:hypothetical protein
MVINDIMTDGRDSFLEDLFLGDYFYTGWFALCSCQIICIMFA